VGGRGPWRLLPGALAARGDAVALVSRTGEVRYGELERRGAAVAAGLRGAGLEPGEPVALLSAGRAHDEPAALAGVLAGGFVAVPLDAGAPPARLRRIAAARGCRALVHDAAGAALADALEAALAEPGGPVGPDALCRLTLDADGEVQRAPAAVAAPPRADRDADLACILHTSGSTGEPKPVPITWAGLDAFTAWAIALVNLGPGDRVLRVAELIFDLAWFDHLATFRAGAALATMSRRDLASGRALRDAVAALRPTVIYGVPSMYMKLVAALPEGAALDPSPRAILFAGEVFPPRELEALASRAGGAALFNLYGPTETNVCTFHRVDPAELDGVRQVPIGLACPYATCALVAEDGSGRVIEGPGTGELVVSGPTTVGGGPFATRDRVERGEDGLFHFRGRLDRMVKIRGYRVEPGEVEAALAAHPAVRQAAVIAVDDARLGRVLRGFVAAAANEGAAELEEQALRMFLAERVPPSMVPDRIVLMAELPRTATGKIDYRALVDEGS